MIEDGRVLALGVVALGAAAATVAAREGSQVRVGPRLRVVSAPVSAPVQIGWLRSAATLRLAEVWWNPIGERVVVPDPNDYPIRLEPYAVIAVWKMGDRYLGSATNPETAKRVLAYERRRESVRHKKRFGTTLGHVPAPDAPGGSGSPVRVGPRLRPAAESAAEPVVGVFFISLSNHLAELGAIHREDPDFVWDPYRVVAAPSIEEANKRARRDYDAVLGKTFSVSEVTGSLGGTFDETETWTCRPQGCRVKVLPASDQDIIHQWSSPMTRLDPIWPVEIVDTVLPEESRALADLDWAYVKGRSYVVVAPR